MMYSDVRCAFSDVLDWIEIIPEMDRMFLKPFPKILVRVD